MLDTSSHSAVARRSFLSRLGAGLTFVGTALAAGESPAAAQASSASGWQPARHAQDDWLDQVPGKHRFVFDTTSPNGIGDALLYANNYFLASQSGYGLGNSDAAVVIVARHFATPFAYTDAMWAKYGAVIGQLISFDDPKTKQRPTINVYTTGSDQPPLDGLVKRGVHFAVCQLATRFFAGAIAGTNGSADSVYNELVANLVPSSHIVAAGILAVNRAQERGYSFAHGG